MQRGVGIGSALFGEKAAYKARRFDG